MNFNEFQEHAKRTQPPEGNADDITNYALGLIGEAAEVSEMIKKWRYHGHTLDRIKVAEELGDVMHYLAGLCTMINYSMEVVAEMNVDKLLDRYPDGFREEASRNRSGEYYTHVQMMKDYDAYVKEMKKCGYEREVMRFEDYYVKQLKEKGLLKKAVEIIAREVG